MNSERWEKLQEIFEHAADLDVAERSAYLDETCGGDAELRRESEALLTADQGADTLLSGVMRDAVSGTIGERLLDATGKMFGPYRVVSLIGQGGMGVVYLAERADEQYHARVAIKLVNAVFTQPLMLERLLSERQILANLHHPNIAGLLDGGTTPEGAPYLVMEYIEGVPIDQYCDRERLGVIERIALFRDVCSAVHYAHESLIVHRDLKPNNILVTSEGVPKLLDFGIAKLIESDQASRADLTQVDQRMLTPNYASPEHISGGRITTASDTYSLGALLYKLLTGRPPSQFETGSMLELERAMLISEPRLPSVAVRSHGEAGLEPQDVAEARGTTPDRLGRALRGDLDNIVLMALRKEPERRYRSANQLAEDLRRHADGRPVVARRDTWSYITGKFVQRHLLGVATAALAVIFLMGFAVMLWHQNERIRRALESSEAAADFLVSLFEVSDPTEAQGSEIRAVDVMAAGEVKIEQELAQQPELQATLIDALGRVYHSLAQYPDASRLLEQAVAMRMQQADESKLASSLSSLGSTRLDLGDLDGAEGLQRRSLSMNEAEFGRNSVPVAHNLQRLGAVLMSKGDLDGANEAFRESVAIFGALLGPDDVNVSSVKNDHAAWLINVGDYDGAESVYRELLESDSRHLGRDHPHVAFHMSNLAQTLHFKGEPAEAEPLFREALARMRRVLGNRHGQLSGSLTGLGRVLHDRGDLAGAEEAFREALEIDRARGERQYYTGYDMVNLAVLLRDSGRPAEAETLLRDALDIYQEAYRGEPHPYTGSALANLGDVLVQLHRLQEAEATLNEALTMWELTGTDANHWLVATTRSVLGHCLARQGRLAEAEPLLVQSYPVIRDGRGEEDRRTRRSREWIVALYEVWGRPDEAARYREPAGTLTDAEPDAST